MDIKSVYDIAGRAMAAQLVRLNTVASNLANAGSTTGDPKLTYRPLKPIFETQYSDLVKKGLGLEKSDKIIGFIYIGQIDGKTKNLPKIDEKKVVDFW